MAKSGVSDLLYYGEKGAGPHALTTILKKSQAISDTLQQVAYTDFKKVKSIREGTRSLDIVYGVDEQRIKEVEKQGKNVTTRYFTENYQEEQLPDGTVRKISYICNAGAPVALYVQTRKGFGKGKIVGGGTAPVDQRDLYWLQTDRQGSLTTITDYNGKPVEKYEYDPWGNRIDPTDWSKEDKRTERITDRGYTMHQHLDNFRLINMNGRVYDPLLGMFLSPDPYIQEPGNWLNFNRYSYCLNNPLMYTDPTGKLFGIDDVILMAIVGGAIGNVISQMGAGKVNGIGDMFKAFGVGALSGMAGYRAGTLSQSLFGGVGFISGLANGAAGGFAGGFSAALGNGESFRNALKTGGIGAGIGGLMSGLASGFEAIGNGGNFLTGKGTILGEYVTGISDSDDNMEQYIENAKTYENSLNAEKNDIFLRTRVEREYDITRGKYGIKEITTRVAKNYGLDDYGYYANLKTHDAVGGVALYNGPRNISVHISPAATLSGHINFRAIAGHELIHAYHFSTFGPHTRTVSERVAYEYSIKTYLNAGDTKKGLLFIGNALRLNFLGPYPAIYGNIPFIH